MPPKTSTKTSKKTVKSKATVDSDVDDGMPIKRLATTSQRKPLPNKVVDVDEQDDEPTPRFVYCL